MYMLTRILHPHSSVMASGLKKKSKRRPVSASPVGPPLQQLGGQVPVVFQGKSGLSIGFHGFSMGFPMKKQNHA